MARWMSKEDMCTHIQTHTHTHGTLIQSLKKSKILPFVTMWVNLKGIMLSKISQTEKADYSTISLACAIRNTKLTETGTRLVVARGEYELPLCLRPPALPNWHTNTQLSFSDLLKFWFLLSCLWGLVPFLVIYQRWRTQFISLERLFSFWNLDHGIVLRPYLFDRVIKACDFVFYVTFFIVMGSNFPFGFQPTK